MLEWKELAVESLRNLQVQVINKRLERLRVVLITGHTQNHHYTLVVFRRKQLAELFDNIV